MCVVLFVLGGLALGGCAFTPEQAVLREVLQTGGGLAGMQTQPDTLSILQRQQQGEEVIYLVTYQAVRSSGELSECLALYQTQRRGLQWQMTGAGAGCGPAGGDGKPIGVGSGRQGGVGSRPGLSHASGLIYDQAVKAVDVVWDDGEVQAAEVANGSYLALRSGLYEVAAVQALNGEGEAVYAYERQPPAPGKQ
jgi:hypothetical protein